MATGKNWIKLGKLTPQQVVRKSYFFSREYIENLKQEMLSGVNKALKSRRNKKYVSGNALYNSYVGEKSANIEPIQRLLEIVEKHSVKLTEEVQQLLLAECALQMLLEQEGNIADKSGSLEKYLKGQLRDIRYSTLIDDLIVESGTALLFIGENPALFEVEYMYEAGEDILGLLYISSKNMANRKATGSYYTPTHVVKHMIQKLCLGEQNLAEKLILDPCCGTGNFLLQLPEEFKISNIYGNDVDEISVKITRLNLALKYQPKNTEVLYKNVTQLNYLCQFNKEGFDYILGNPPWGYSFTEEEKISPT